MHIRSTIVAAAAVSLLGACGSRDAANGTVVAQANGTTVTKQADGTTTITSPQGSAQIHTGAPSGALPGGLPAYPSAQAAGGMEISGTTQGQQGRVVTFTTADQPRQVLDFYANAAQQAGMQTLARTEMGGSSSLALMKGNEAVTVTATGGEGGTQVQIAGGSR
jgi:hypothetical protein